MNTPTIDDLTFFDSIFSSFQPFRSNSAHAAHAAAFSSAIQTLSSKILPARFFFFNDGLSLADLLSKRVHALQILTPLGLCQRHT
jgi:hypothetical protein